MRNLYNKSVSVAINLVAADANKKQYTFDMDVPFPVKKVKWHLGGMCTADNPIIMNIGEFSMCDSKYIGSIGNPVYMSALGLYHQGESIPNSHEKEHIFSSVKSISGSHTFLVDIHEVNDSATIVDGKITILFTFES